jgi:hypothetical protein
MATIRATLGQSLEEASSATRRAAAARGYALAEGESTPYVLVFKKGVALFSWGSQLTVAFEVCAPSETRLTVSTSERFSPTDWGRGRRAARGLLDALGAVR